MAKVFDQCSMTIENYSGTPLPYNPALVSLSGTVQVYQEPLQKFQRVLLNSPSLHTLHIKAYHNAGCVPNRYGPPSFLRYDPSKVAQQGDYPNLSELLLDSLSVPASTASFMCWSRLRNLALKRGNPFPFLQALVPASSSLPSLRDFTLHTWYMPQDFDVMQVQAIVNDFLSSASGLYNLEMEGPYNILTDVIGATHGGSLEALSLHSPEMRGKDRDLMSFTRLSDLGRNCVKLRKLTLDVDNECLLPVEDMSAVRVEVSSYRLPYNMQILKVPQLSQMITAIQSESSFPELECMCVNGIIGIANHSLPWTPSVVKERDFSSIAFKRAAAVLFEPGIRISGLYTGTSLHRKLQSFTIVLGGQRGMGMGLLPCKYRSLFIHKSMA